MGYLFLKFTISLTLFLPVWVVFRLLFLRKYPKINKNKTREILLAFFVIFQVALLGMVFQSGSHYLPDTSGIQAAIERIRMDIGINLTPFYTIKNFYRYGTTSSFAVNIVGNIAMFVPIGFFLPLLWKRWQKIWKITCVAVLVPLIIETTQLFLGRSVDVDDIILNCTGILMGYLIWRLCLLAGLQQYKYSQ